MEKNNNIPEKFNQLFRIVKAMRENQKRYFTYRSSVDLSNSKKLEREVDKIITAIEKESNNSQMTLF